MLNPKPRNSVLELKSASLSVPALILYGIQFDEITNHLQEKIAQAPEFFKHSPVLVDLQKLEKPQTDTELTALFTLLREHDLFPIGIKAASDTQNAYALTAKIPVLPVHAPHVGLMPESQQKTAALAENIAAQDKIRDINHELENKLITHPIRSGQRVYAKGDLIVTAMVSPGAEVLAEGNIHIYGSLRGKALAGVLGNVDSRIFCFDLQAELISIAGIYKLSDEEMDKQMRGKPVQISLHEQTLLIKAI